MRLVPLLLVMALIGVMCRAMSPEAAESFRAFEQRAEAGEPEAMWRLSAILEQGYDTIAPDTLRSLTLLKRAAAACHPDARNYLGFLYGEGKLLPLDLDSAIYWLRLAADQGNPRAQYNLAYKLLPDTAALPLLTKAVDAGLPQAMTLLADLKSGGKAIPKDSVGAAELYTQAIRNGWRDAELRLLNLIGPGLVQLPPAELLSMARDYTEAGAYTLAAEVLLAIPEGVSEEAEALLMLGHAYAKAQGVPYDYTKANEAFRRSAALGNPEAIRIVEELDGLFPTGFDF